MLLIDHLRRRWLMTSTYTLILAGLVGCGDGTPPKLKTYPAVGIVRMDNKPFGPCIVELVPENAGKTGVNTRTVTGTADAEGKITFGSYGISDGAVAGNYKAVIRSSLSAPPPGPIPARYGSQASTPLTASIKESDKNEVALDMQSSGGSGGKGGDAFTSATKSDAFKAGAPK